MTDTSLIADDTANSAKDQATAAADTGDKKELGSDKKEATVPSFRLREETERRKAVEEQYNESQKALDAYRQKEKDAEEKKAIES
jgi:hypothetical protein